jgi:hypothetical protein
MLTCAILELTETNTHPAGGNRQGAIMDYIDAYLDQLDSEYNSIEFDAGWLAAQEGRAHHVNGGIGIDDGTAVEVVNGAVADGVREYWAWAGITTPSRNGHGF